MDRRSLWKKVEVPTWTLDKLWEISVGYSSRSEFRENNYGIYDNHVSIDKNILNKICSHMDVAFRWTPELAQEEALKYKTRKEFEEGSPGCHSYARRKNKNFINKICEHMNTKVSIKWTPKLVQEEALKYTVLGEFRKKSSGAYGYANRYEKTHPGFLDKIYSHMNKRTMWTPELVQEKALKCIILGEFKKNYGGALEYARKYNKEHPGFLDKITSHMKKRGEK